MTKIIQDKFYRKINFARHRIKTIIRLINILFSRLWFDEIRGAITGHNLADEKFCIQHYGINYGS